MKNNENVFTWYARLAQGSTNYIPLNAQQQLYFPDSQTMDRLCTLRASAIDVRVLYGGSLDDHTYAQYADYKKLLAQTPGATFFEQVDEKSDMRVTRAEIKIKTAADLASRLNGLRLTHSQNFS